MALQNIASEADRNSVFCEKTNVRRTKSSSYREMSAKNEEKRGVSPRKTKKAIAESNSPFALNPNTPAQDELARAPGLVELNSLRPRRLAGV